jgi:DNA-binding winged helix-turn-helix (wHTH) protein
MKTFVYTRATARLTKTAIFADELPTACRHAACCLLIRIAKEGSIMIFSDSETRYAFEDFEVDLATFELRKKGRAVPIQPLVFDLLVHLLRNRDRMVSYGELSRVVWDNSLVSAAAARQAVSVLRKTLDDDGRRQRLVKNVSKRGYRFVADVIAEDCQGMIPVTRVNGFEVAAHQ